MLLYVCAHILIFFSIYWSDTSLIASLRLEYWLCTRVLDFLMLCILVLP